MNPYSVVILRADTGLSHTGYREILSELTVEDLVT